MSLSLYDAADCYVNSDRPLVAYQLSRSELSLYDAADSYVHSDCPLVAYQLSRSELSLYDAAVVFSPCGLGD